MACMLNLQKFQQSVKAKHGACIHLNLRIDINKDINEDINKALSTHHSIVTLMHCASITAISYYFILFEN